MCSNKDYVCGLTVVENTHKYFILTGDPGIGKSTIIKKIAQKLMTKGVEPVGFYTEEVRKDGLRQGFDIISFTGERGKLARDASILSGPPGFKVGKYNVLLQEFERVALPVIKKLEDPENQVLVIDEVGNMEFLSEVFKNTVRDIFSPKYNCIVIATIPLRRRDPLIEFIRKHNLTKLWKVTRENRSKVHEEVLNELAPIFRFQ